MASKQASLILRLIDGVSGPAKGIVASLGAVSGATRTLAGAAMAPARAVTAMSRGLRRASGDTMALSGAMTLGLGAAAKAVYDYEKAGNRMESFGLLSDKQRENLEQEAQRLNKFFPQTNKGIIEAAGELFRAGLTYEQAFGALQGALQLSLAGDIDTQSAADIATNIMYAMKMPMDTQEQIAKSLKTVNDMLAYGATRSNTDIQRMADTFRYVAPLAAVAGMEISEVTAVTMELAKAGIKGSEAGVALRSALVRMAKPTKPMLQAFGRLGIDMADFVKYKDRIESSSITSSLLADGYDLSHLSKNIQEILDDKALAAAPQRMLARLSDLVVSEIGDESVRAEITQSLQDAILAGGQKVDFLKLMKVLREKGATITDIAQIFDVRMGSRLAAILFSDLDEATAKVEKEFTGTTEAMAERMIKGIVGNWLELSAALENFAITIADSGVLNSVAKVFDKMSTSLTELSKVNPKIIELGTYAAIALAAMAPLGLAISGVTAVLGLAINPLAWVVGGLVAFAAINFGALTSWLRAFGKIFVDNLSPEVLAFASWGIDKVTTAYNDLVKAGQSGEGWARTAKEWGENVAWGVNTAYDALSKVGTYVKEWFDWAGIDPSVLGTIGKYALLLGVASIGVGLMAGAITRLASALFVLSGAKFAVGALGWILGIGGGGAAAGAGAGAAAAGGGALAGLFGKIRKFGVAAGGLAAIASLIPLSKPYLEAKSKPPAPNTPADYFLRYRRSQEEAAARERGLESAARTKDDAVQRPLEPVLHPSVMNENLQKLEGQSKQTGEVMERNLSVTAKPLIDTSSLDAALAKARAFVSALASAGGGPAPLHYTGDHADGSARIAGGRASGGPIRRGLTYEINERGRETVTMGTNGYVTPAHKVGGGGGRLFGDLHIHGVSADEVMAKLDRTISRALERSRQVSATDRPVY